MHLKNKPQVNVRKFSFFVFFCIFVFLHFEGKTEELAFEREVNLRAIWGLHVGFEA